VAHESQRGCGRTALIWVLRRAVAPSFSCAELCTAEPAGASQRGRTWACDPSRTLASDADTPPLPLPLMEPAAPPDLAILQELWAGLNGAYLAANGLHVQTPPGYRGFGATPDADFVSAGVRMPPAAAAAAAAQWRAFLAAAPPFNRSAGLFAGSGVAIGGGGLGYISAAWACLRALRRTGCTLPVEVWFLAHEAPSARPGSPSRPLLRALAAHGAVARSVGEAMGADAPLAAGYALKPLALLFSRFERVLWLDADQLPLADPSFLLEGSPVFFPPEAGMLLWRDFWDGSAAPDAAAVLGGGDERAFTVAMRHTCESGQLVLRKEQAWAPLLLALFLNLQSPLYYRLLSSYMGAGDKETWPAAMAALRAPAAWAAAPPGALGVAAPRRPDVLLVSAMLQHSPRDGQPLFLHANRVKPAPHTVPLTRGEQAQARRWPLATAAGYDAERQAGAGGGLRPAPAAVAVAERYAWADVATLYCAPWFAAYADERRLRHGELLTEPGAEVAPVVGLVLWEHAGGRYRELRQWRLSARGLWKERIGQ